jgi:hypothetical protein
MEKRATVRTQKSVRPEHCYYSAARTYEKILLFSVQIIMNPQLLTAKNKNKTVI